MSEALKGYSKGVSQVQRLNQERISFQSIYVVFDRIQYLSGYWTKGSQFLADCDHPQVLSGGPSAHGNLLHQNSQGSESTGKTEVRLINIQLSYRLQEIYPGERVCSRP